MNERGGTRCHYVPPAPGQFTLLLGVIGAGTEGSTEFARQIARGLPVCLEIALSEPGWGIAQVCAPGQVGQSFCRGKADGSESAKVLSNDVSPAPPLTR